jgi:hypothetical protein
MSNVSKRLRIFAAAVVASISLFAASARADVVDCQPERARATADRLDARCQGIDRWFIAWRSNTDATALNQMLSLLNAAILSGKTVKIYYSLDGSGNGILWAVEIFR